MSPPPLQYRPTCVSTHVGRLVELFGKASLVVEDVASHNPVCFLVDRDDLCVRGYEVTLVLTLITLCLEGEATLFSGLSISENVTSVS